MPKQISDNGLRFTAAWENFSPVPYFATAKERAEGKRTIGHGHVILPGESFTSISAAEGLVLLRNDIAKAVNYVNQYAHPSCNQAQFDALVDHCFNGGPGSIKPDNIVGDFDDHVRSGNWQEVRKRLLEFKYQGGVVMLGLVRRTVGRQALFDGKDWITAEKIGRAVSHT